MVTKSTKNVRRRRNHRHTSKRITIDTNCWGKNKPLEQFWRELSSYLSVVIIYKGSKPYEVIKLKPASSAHEIYTQLRSFDNDPQVVAILTSHPDVNNAYETIVYPNAKDKTVDYAIMNYSKIFKHAQPHMQKMFKTPLKKLRIPK
jgi:hypothetical protein